MKRRNNKNGIRCIRRTFPFGWTFLAIVTEYQYKEGPKRKPEENMKEDKGMGFIPKSAAYFLNK
jgi:hypothetical protein